MKVGKHDAEGSVLRASIVSHLRAVGAQTLKTHGHRLQAPGWPDLYVAHPKWTGWIEAKVGDAKLSAAQENCMARLLRAGAKVATLRFYWDEKAANTTKVERLRIFVQVPGAMGDGVEVQRPHTGAAILRALQGLGYNGNNNEEDALAAL